MKKFFTLALSFLSALTVSAQDDTVVTFEAAPLADNACLAGTSYEEGGFVFDNDYSNDGWEYNAGYTVSNMTDRNTNGFLNQYSVDARGGALGSKNFIIYNPSFYNNCYIRRADNAAFTPKEIAVAMPTYTSLTVQDGDDFARKFAKGDYLSITFTGMDAEGFITKELTVRLIDYPMMWLPWAAIDLSELGTMNKLFVSLDSSDSSYGYMNTPAYVAFDNFTAAAQSPTEIAAIATQQPARQRYAYNLRGMKVSDTSARGLYIVDGKKVVR